MWSRILHLLVFVACVYGLVDATVRESRHFGRNNDLLRDDLFVYPEEILAEKMKLEIAKKIRPDYRPGKQMVSPEARALSYNFAMAKAKHLKNERLSRRRHRRNQEHSVISKYFQDSNMRNSGSEHLTIQSKTCPYCKDDENRIWFNIAELASYTFDEATLHVDIGHIKTKYPGYEYKLQFYVFINNDKVVEYRHSQKPNHFDNATNPSESIKKWEEMVITPLVRKWNADSSTNFGAMVKVSIYKDGQLTETMPLLVSHRVYYLEMSNTKRRVKRDFNYKKKELTALCSVDTGTGDVERPTNDTCCRYPYKVDFTSIKWNFIIYPKVFENYYCTGYCDLGALRKVTHSEVLFMYDMELCCAADLADDLEIVYMDDEGGIHVKFLPNMIVQSCACG
uniref:TGF_BETA_2 domain-containing protein n=1 Tax=Panagrellus redivivus TaxID=6233 RepID=A0A7E4VN72_PANRE